MKTPVISMPGQGEVMPAGPTRTLVRVPGAATDDRLGVVELHVEAGWSGPPPHSHGEAEHLWYVLDGEIELLVDEDRATYGPGSCLYIPAGLPHGFATEDSGPSVMLQVDTPRALDGYFRDLVGAFPPGRPVDPVQVAEIMRRHDTRPLIDRG